MNPKIRFFSLLTILLCILAPTSLAETYKAGDEVFAKRSGRWKVGRIVKFENSKYFIQFKGYPKPDWIKAEYVKPPKKSGPWLVGDFVAVTYPETGVLYRGNIIDKRGENEFHIHYVWDNTKEWVTADRIHAAANESGK